MVKIGLYSYFEDSARFLHLSGLTIIKNLMIECSIKKTIENDRTAYHIVSEEKVKSEIEADLFDMITYMLSFGGIGERVEEFVDDLTDAAIREGKEKAYEEKLVKPLVQMRERASEFSEPEEMHYMLRENQMIRLKEKYLQANAELLKTKENPPDSCINSQSW